LQSISWINSLTDLKHWQTSKTEKANIFSQKVRRSRPNDNGCEHGRHVGGADANSGKEAGNYGRVCHGVLCKCISF